MATYTPDELWHLWKTEQLPLEMATGHLLQHLIQLHSEIETERRAVFNLRADVDRLITYTQLPLLGKGKLKPSKMDATNDPEQPA